MAWNYMCGCIHVFTSWCNAWITGESYEREREVQLGSESSARWEGKKTESCLDSMKLPREKQAGLYQGKYKSPGPDVATGGCCQEAAS